MLFASKICSICLFYNLSTSCQRFALGFRQLSVKPCPVNFLKKLALKEVKFPIVLLLS